MGHGASTVGITHAASDITDSFASNYVNEGLSFILHDIARSSTNNGIHRRNLKIKTQESSSAKSSSKIASSRTTPVLKSPTSMQLIETPASKHLLKSTRSLRTLALRHQSNIRNSYISQEAIHGSVSPAKSKTGSEALPSTPSALANKTITDKKGKPLNLQILLPDVSDNKRISGMVSMQDDVDWIQVSDDELEVSKADDDAGGGKDKIAQLPSGIAVSSRLQAAGGRPVKKLTLNVSAEESYLFTKSGTILIDGFGNAGIRKGGIVEKEHMQSTTPAAYPMPMRHRLVILSRLGSGASSTVYKALDLKDLRLVALKMVNVYEKAKRHQMVTELKTLFHVLKCKRLHSRDGSSSRNSPSRANSQNKDSPGWRSDESFEDSDQEKRSFGSQSNYSSHPKPGYEYIVSFFDAFSNVEDGGVVLMIEYMDGGSLQDIVDAGGCEDENVLATIARQALEGLRFLHHCHQLHRDLKPGNFLITNQGILKLGDFGILRDMSDDAGALMMMNQALQVSVDDNSTVDQGIHRQRHNMKFAEESEFKSADLDQASAMNDGDHIPIKRESEPRSRSVKFELDNDSEQENDSGDEATDQTHSLKKSLDSQKGQLKSTTSEAMVLTNSKLHRARTFVGTATYMSPERIDGREYSYPSDVWAFGLSMMSVALGKLPINTKGGYWTLVQSIRDDEPPALPNDGRFSPEFRDFISKCLAKDPDERHPCSKLLRHKFIEKATTAEMAFENKEIDKECEESGVRELGEIVDALCEHILKLKSDACRGATPHGDEGKHFFGDMVQDSTADIFKRVVLGGDAVVEVAIAGEAKAKEEATKTRSGVVASSSSSDVKEEAECAVEFGVEELGLVPPKPFQSIFMGDMSDEQLLSRWSELALQLHISPRQVLAELNSGYQRLLDGSEWEGQENPVSVGDTG